MKYLNQYLLGDTIEVLRSLPDGVVQCVVTSPPYWGLRTYGDDGQYGLEVTPEEHIAQIVEVFREIRRVLRKDGTVWLNYGDSYAGSGKGGNPEGSEWSGFVGNKDRERTAMASKPIIPAGLKAKDLCMIPARVAIALQADGWWIRSDIIWAKPNPMPESCTDRPTSSYEHIFLLTKSAKYFYDADAVREKTGNEASWEDYPEHRGGWNKPESDILNEGATEVGQQFTHPSGRNLRNVWYIPTYSFSGAHFATFPPALVKRCVLAGTSHKACEVCGAPWERVTEPSEEYKKKLVTAQSRGIYTYVKSGEIGSGAITGGKANPSVTPEYLTLGFQPTCFCEQKGTGKCVVCDIFMGSGTTAVVAQELGRDWIGIDLGGKDGEYKKMAMKRLQGQPIGLNF